MTIVAIVVQNQFGVMMSDLKLCPFCGGEAYHDSASCWNHDEEKWMPNFWHRVICKNCGNQTKSFYTEAEAIEAWNRRTEREAKAEWSEVDGCHLCGECGFAVAPKCDMYCAGCGCKLDWNDNE